ncbi:MAG: DinB family protein [Acidobacteriota bacterium]
MKLTDFFLDQLESEAASSRKTVERVPDGGPDWKSWKPHDKSMEMGYLAFLVATMPEWIDMILRLDELDVAPKGPGAFKPPEFSNARDLAAACDGSAKKARKALGQTNDEYLMTKWKLLAGGRVVDEPVRYRAVRDVFTHLAHHRGQLTVYLRLNGAKVPSIYGPTADDKSFG